MEERRPAGGSDSAESRRRGGLRRRPEDEAAPGGCFPLFLLARSTRAPLETSRPSNVGVLRGSGGSFSFLAKTKKDIVQITFLPKKEPDLSSSLHILPCF
jgi:hypothetical protein